MFHRYRVKLLALLCVIIIQATARILSSFSLAPSVSGEKKKKGGGGIKRILRKRDNGGNLRRFASNKLKKVFAFIVLEGEGEIGPPRGFFSFCKKQAQFERKKIYICECERKENRNNSLKVFMFILYMYFLYDLCLLYKLSDFFNFVIYYIYKMC